MSVVIRRLFLETSYISNASHCSSERKLLLSAPEVSLMINTGDSWGILGIPTYAHTRTHTQAAYVCAAGVAWELKWHNRSEGMSGVQTGREGE